MKLFVLELQTEDYYRGGLNYVAESVGEIKVKHHYKKQDYQIFSDGVYHNLFMFLKPLVEKYSYGLETFEMPESEFARLLNERFGQKSEEYKIISYDLKEDGYNNLVRLDWVREKIKFSEGLYLVNTIELPENSKAGILNNFIHDFG